MNKVDSPLVSVVVPCYNSEKFIVETIESVLAQTYDNFELIVVDDGSTDNSGQLISQFNDKRLNYLRRSNGGAGYARNLGIRQSRGEYIALLDSDDLYLPNNLKEKVQFLEENEFLGLVHSQEIVFDSSTGSEIKRTQGLHGNVLKELLALEETVIHSPSSVVFRKSLIERAGYYREDIAVCEDWEFWVRLAKCSDFGYIAEPLTKYRIHSGQIHSNISVMENGMLKVLPDLKSKGFWSSSTAFRRSKSKLFWTLGLCFLKDELRPKKGLFYLARSILISPTIAIEYFIKRLKKE